MAGSVVHRLDDDPVGRHLDRGRQRLDVVVGLDGPGHPRAARDGNRPPGCARRRAARRAETRPSWSRAGGRSPSTSRRTSAMSSRAWSESWTDQLRGALRVLGDEVAGGLQPHGQRGEGGAEAVVEVAADPAPFLLARADEVLPGQLQLAVGRHRLDERTDLAADVLEEAAVARRRTGRGPASTSSRSRPTGVPPTASSTVARRSARLADRGLDRVGAPSPNTSIAAQDSWSRRASSASVSRSASVGRGQRVEPAQVGDDLVRGSRGRRTRADGSTVEPDGQRQQQQGDQPAGHHRLERGVRREVHRRPRRRRRRRRPAPPPPPGPGCAERWARSRRAGSAASPRPGRSGPPAPAAAPAPPRARRVRR